MKDSHQIAMKYGVPFKKDEQMSRSTTLSEGVYAYMAQFPGTKYDSPDLTLPYSNTPITITPDGTITNAPISNNKELMKLLDAVSALKGQTAEIYKLKALAFTIKANLVDDK
jgi:hypothetical protein